MTRRAAVLVIALACFAGPAAAQQAAPVRVAIAGTSIAVVSGFALAFTTLPLWGLLTLMSVFALGLGTTFPVSVVSLQNSVARAQIGTLTGAMNFFRALMASFTVAAFTAILLMALGADIQLAGEHRGSVSSIPVSDMIAAFRWVFGAAALMMTCAAVCLTVMEERPLAGESFFGPADAEGDGGPGFLVEFVGGFTATDVRNLLTDASRELLGEPDDGVDAFADQAVVGLTPFNGVYPDADLRTVLERLQLSIATFRQKAANP